MKPSDQLQEKSPEQLLAMLEAIEELRASLDEKSQAIRDEMARRARPGPELSKEESLKEAIPRGWGKHRKAEAGEPRSPREAFKKAREGAERGQLDTARQMAWEAGVISAKLTDPKSLIAPRPAGLAPLGMEGMVKAAELGLALPYWEGCLESWAPWRAELTPELAAWEGWVCHLAREMGAEEGWSEAKIAQLRAEMASAMEAARWPEPEMRKTPSV